VVFLGSSQKKKYATKEQKKKKKKKRRIIYLPTCIFCFYMFEIPRFHFFYSAFVLCGVFVLLVQRNIQKPDLKIRKKNGQ
jgi:hypothetical protein